MCRKHEKYSMTNIMVFNRFHVYRKIEFLMSWGSFLELFWKVFGVLWVTFGGLRGCRNVVEISRIPWGTPNPGNIPRGRENLDPQG